MNAITGWTTWTDICVEPSGRYMYVISWDSEIMYRLDLSTPWDLSTAVFDDTGGIPGGTSYIRGVFVNDDGDYVGLCDSGDVRLYRLGPPDFGASFGSSRGSVSLPSTGHGVSFKEDGLKFFALSDGAAARRIYEYTMPAAWNLAGAVQGSFYTFPFDQNPTGLWVSRDGTTMVVCGRTSDSAYQFNLSTPWDITTVTTGPGLNISAAATNPQGIALKDDLTRMYVLDDSGVIRQYSQ